MPDSVQTFLDQLATSFAATLSQLMACEVTPSSEPEQEASSAELWCTAQIHEAAGCQLAVGITRAAGLLLARALLSEVPGEGAEFTAEDQELLAEFWKQAFGRATTDLKSLLNDVALDYTSAQSPEWQPAASSKVTLRSDKAKLTFTITVASELVQRLNAGVAVAANSAETTTSAAETNNLDLLLDVPLAVTLRFGQRPMPLREILQLTSGSVVELDRQADDAVDLLLEERLIARGQVVVVDGCYGLRVTEVVR